MGMRKLCHGWFSFYRRPQLTNKSTQADPVELPLTPLAVKFEQRQRT